MEQRSNVVVGEYFNMVDSIDNWTVKGAFRHRMELGSATLFLNKSFQPYHMVIDINTGLPQGWAYAPSIDLELKQYTLLGYLQRIQGRFDEYKLYPHLEHIQAQVAELRQLRNDKRAWADRLHGELTGFDPSTGALIHERPLQGELLRVIDEVIAFAVPGLSRMESQGIGLREELVQHMSLAPVGIQPLHLAEGWLLMRTGDEARVYGYSIPFLRERNEDLRHHNIVTRYVTSHSLGLGTTFERIKADLIQQYPQWPNPATFAVETDLELPYIETYVPLAKWLAFAHITAA
ncbi:MAG: hypothetical protein IPH05_10455 [Flavobacteriales bacterium]|jgi:hypothetical protein|nr:hypothetical protein [Flavobacteriales bacterium]MBK6552011.1 hypothetical protein [Flavobacteriales bacterium]MBK6883345.1 hypothetical protein [Flavobacteriales bacterium]MBK7113911.1 hypothetical protein [Flavobacteriales bacterium]MBK7483146.1 hypothetical protein [Flavobacteriales bacterium]